VLPLTALAIAVRLAWVLLVPTHPVGDFAMYLESARYLVEHGRLDPEFIYMPGYVWMAAGVYALGGGLLAIKMIGVAAGGLATAAVYGIGRRLFGRPSAIAAGLLCALWPADVAVSSVTGTDMPAAAMLALAVWLLVALAKDRPLGAPAAFGLVMGLSVYIRAIALPLIVLAGLHFRAQGARWAHVVTRTIAALFVALVLLVPWGIRNHGRYGEFFLTDSHGGHTALVGANPNSEGTYSRSLNRLFSEGTGYSLFKPPHRESDRVAYDLAVRWTKDSPGYALGLLVAKADRLLGRERSLLYWPLYRQSVLPHDKGDNWFDVHRTGIERVVDGFWCFLLAMTLVGILAAWFGRNWPALSLLPLPIGLAAVYTLFFAEPRYGLAVVVLLLPFAGAGVIWTIGASVDLFSRRGSRQRLVREVVVAVLAVAALFVGWPQLVNAGERLRTHDRWAACLCQVGAEKRICDVVPADLPPGAPSPVRGVWDGFGLSLRQAPAAAAALDLPLVAATYQIVLRADAVPTGTPVDIVVRANGRPLTEGAVSPQATEITLAGKVAHTGGNLHLEFRARRVNSDGPSDGATLWISGIAIETDLD
jgi:4-amino-4-deoxy-L-arabinose transferase-like glycosyltransferase